MGGPRPSCWDGPSILFRVRSEAQRAESGRLVLGRVSGQSKGIETQGHCVPPSFIFSLNICLVLILPCRECLPRFSRVLDYLSRQQRAIAVCLAVKVESTVQYTEIGGHAFHRCTAQLLHVQGCSQAEERERAIFYLPNSGIIKQLHLAGFQTEFGEFVISPTYNYFARGGGANCSDQRVVCLSLYLKNHMPKLRVK